MRKFQIDAKSPKVRKTDPGRIVAATIACIERFGIEKTSMVDVAAAVGIGRQSLYRVFPTRTQLLEAVAMQRMVTMAERLKEIVSQYESFDDAMIFGTIASIEASRNDPIFLAVVNETHSLGFERYMLSATSPGSDLMASVWGSVLAAARRKGKLRRDVSNEEIINWLRGIQTMLFLQDDLKPRQVEAIMRTFLIPSLSPTAEGTDTPKTRKSRSVRRSDGV